MIYIYLKINGVKLLSVNIKQNDDDLKALKIHAMT